MPVLYVDYCESYSGGEIRAGQENKDWPDYEDEYIDFRITSCHLEKGNAEWLRQEENVAFKPEIGQKVYIVLVRYTTGSTFGTVYGAWFIAGVYDDENRAKEVEGKIEAGKWSDSGVWTGFFSSLEEVFVEEFLVEE
ncbi:MAG: hypothetical protein KGL39_00505 [Patescibacteria group bacterium]|nr:hypothetical protein [Patescibacteria group bacterium]